MFELTVLMPAQGMDCLPIPDVHALAATLARVLALDGTVLGFAAEDGRSLGEVVDEISAIYPTPADALDVSRNPWLASAPAAVQAAAAALLGN